MLLQYSIICVTLFMLCVYIGALTVIYIDVFLRFFLTTEWINGRLHLNTHLNKILLKSQIANEPKESISHWFRLSKRGVKLHNRMHKKLHKIHSYHPGSVIWNTYSTPVQHRDRKRKRRGNWALNTSLPQLPCDERAADLRPSSPTNIISGKSFLGPWPRLWKLSWKVM